MNMQRALTVLAGLGIIVTLLALDHWLFITWFHTPHLHWYLTVGASISLVSSVVSMAWGDLEKQRGLISAHPFTYIGAALQLVGLPLYTLGTHLRSHAGEPRTRPTVDLLLTIPLVLMLVGAMAVWLVVIAPPQYVVYLLCGAPARMFSQSTRRPIAHLQDTQLAVAEIATHEKTPDGWWNIGLSQKPVAVTNLFTSLFLFIVKPLFG